MKNILIAIDFEPKADMLIDKAMSIAEKFGAKIWLVHATAPEPSFVGYEAGPIYVRDLHEAEVKRETKLLEELTSIVASNGIEAESLLLNESSISHIVKEAAKIDADMIVVGSHKHGFLYNLWFGSSTDVLVHKSKIPVLVVPL